MLRNIRVAHLPAERQGVLAMKPQKPALFALIVISITLLGVLLLTNKKLCEVRFRSGGTEVVASMAYESR